MQESIYASGEYLQKHPDWHLEDSPFKARQVLKAMSRNAISPTTICEVGCGAGGILRELSEQLPGECTFDGYDVSPQAIAMAERMSSQRLRFWCDDFIKSNAKTYDVILLMDVIEHIEDYFSFLRQIRPLSRHKMLHVPLDITVQGTMRNSLARGWNEVGHIHAFTKDVALEAVKHCGYRIVDHFYTNRADAPGQNWKLRAASVPRRLAFAVHENIAVRLLGGYSVMIVAE